MFKVNDIKLLWMILKVFWYDMFFDIVCILWKCFENSWTNQASHYKGQKKLLIGLNEKKLFSIIIPHHLNLFSYSSNKPVSSTCNQTLETRDWEVNICNTDYTFDHFVSIKSDRKKFV